MSQRDSKTFLTCKRTIIHVLKLNQPGMVMNLLLLLVAAVKLMNELTLTLQKTKGVTHTVVAKCRYCRNK